MKPSLLTYCALGWLGLVAATGLLAPWLPLAYTPAATDLTQLAVPPSWQGAAPHYLGTDPLGRDLLAGLVFGARHLVLFLVPATALATVAGALLGGAAGYWGNQHLRLPLPVWLLVLGAFWWGLRLPVAVGLGAALLLAAFRLKRRDLALPLDSLVLGMTTLLGVVPRLLLLLVWASGPPLSSGALLLLLALLAWPDTARLVRTQMRQVRGEPFVEAASALGLPPGRVWWHHALPAACRPLRAFAPITLGGLVGLDSTLSFLGVGPAATSSWGLLLGEVRLEPRAWWLVAGPGLALLLTLLALQLLARRYASQPG